MTSQAVSFLLQLLNSVPWTNTETKGVALLQSNVTYKNRPWVGGNRPWAGFGLLAVVCQPLD